MNDSEVVIQLEQSIVEIQGSDLAVVDREIVSIVSEGIQGPPGAPGADAEGATFLAGENIGGHRGLLLNSDGEVEYADALTDTHASRLIGISLNAASLGDEVEVRWSGEVTEGSWNWTPDSIVFLGENGLLTHTPVSSGFLQRVGYAVTATKLFLQIGEPIILN